MGIEIDNKLRTRAISADGAWSGAIYLVGLVCPKRLLIACVVIYCYVCVIE